MRRVRSSVPACGVGLRPRITGPGPRPQGRRGPAKAVRRDLLCGRCVRRFGRASVSAPPWSRWLSRRAQREAPPAACRNSRPVSGDRRLRRSCRPQEPSAGARSPHALSTRCCPAPVSSPTPGNTACCVTNGTSYLVHQAHEVNPLERVAGEGFRAEFSAKLIDVAVECKPTVQVSPSPRSASMKRLLDLLDRHHYHSNCGYQRCKDQICTRRRFSPKKERSEIRSYI